MQEDKGNATSEGTEEPKARTTTSASPLASSRRRPSSWDDSDDSDAESHSPFLPATPTEARIYSPESKFCTEGTSLLLDDIGRELFRLRDNHSQENALQKDDLLDRRRSPARIRRRTKTSTFPSPGWDPADFDDSTRSEKNSFLNCNNRPSFATAGDLQPRLFLNNFFSETCPRNSDWDESDNEVSDERKDSSDELVELEAKQLKGELQLLWDEDTSSNEGSPPFWNRTSRKLSQILEIDETKRDLDFSEDENKDSLRIENLLPLDDDLTTNEEERGRRQHEETNQSDIDYPLPTARPTKSHLLYQGKGLQPTSARFLTSRDFPKAVGHSSESISEDENSMSRAINTTFMTPTASGTEAEVCKYLSPPAPNETLESMRVERSPKKALNENLVHREKVETPLEGTVQELFSGLDEIKSECGEDIHSQFLSPKFRIDIEECDSLKSYKVSESPEGKTYQKEPAESEREMLSPTTNSPKPNSYRKKQSSTSLRIHSNSDPNVDLVSDIKENSKQVKTQNNVQITPSSRTSKFHFQNDLKDNINKYSNRSQKSLKSIKSDGEDATHHHILEENLNVGKNTKSSPSQTPPHSWNSSIGPPLAEKRFTPESTTRPDPTHILPEFSGSTEPEETPYKDNITRTPKRYDNTPAGTLLNSPWQSARDPLTEPAIPRNLSMTKTHVYTATGNTEQEKNQHLGIPGSLPSLHEEIPKQEPEDCIHEECNYTKTNTKLHYCKTKCTPSTGAQVYKMDKDEQLVKKPETFRSESSVATSNECTILTDCQIIQWKLHKPGESNVLPEFHIPQCEGLTNAIQTTNDKQGPLSVSQLPSRPSSPIIENEYKSKGNTEAKTLQKQLWKNLMDAFEDHDDQSKNFSMQRSKPQNSSLQNINHPFPSRADIADHFSSLSPSKTIAMNTQLTGNHSLEQIPNPNPNPHRQPTSSERSDGMILNNSEGSLDETSAETPVLASLGMSAEDKRKNPIGEFGDGACYAERGHLSEPDKKPRDHGDGVQQGIHIDSPLGSKHHENSKISNLLQPKILQIDTKASDLDTNALQIPPINTAKVISYSHKKPKTHHSIFLYEMFPENKILQAPEHSLPYAISPKTELHNPTGNLPSPDDCTKINPKQMPRNVCSQEPPETTTATVGRNQPTEHTKPFPSLASQPQTQNRSSGQDQEPKRWLTVSKRRKPNRPPHKPKPTLFQPQKPTASQLLHTLPSTRRPPTTLLHLRKPNCFQTLCHRLTGIFCLTSVSSPATSSR